MLERMAESRRDPDDRSRRSGTARMNDANLTLEAVDIAEILKLLPHRYPSLMVDRIVNLRADGSALK